MERLTRERLTEKAIRIDTDDCYSKAREGFGALKNPHPDDCVEITYRMAEQFVPGDKAHKMSYTEHTSEPGKFLRAASPYCGSKKRGYGYAGTFVSEVTCLRCMR